MPAQAASTVKTGFLPLNKTDKINLFGWAATDQGFLVAGGGSGGTVIHQDNKVTLTQALEKEGIGMARVPD